MSEPNKTAPGTLACKDGSTLTVTFDIGVEQYTFSGTFTPTVLHFTVSDTTLTFQSLEQLSGVQSFTGVIGPYSFCITLDNGPVITGRIEPSVIPPIHISGEGEWTQTGGKKLVGTATSRIVEKPKGGRGTIVPPAS